MRPHQKIGSFKYITLALTTEKFEKNRKILGNIQQHAMKRFFFFLLRFLKIVLVEYPFYINFTVFKVIASYSNLNHTLMYHLNLAIV